MKILPILLCLMCSLVSSYAQDTIQIYGGNYLITRKDTNAVYLKNEKAPGDTIRLKLFKGNLLRVTDNHVLDSCFIDDTLTVICSGTVRFTISNCYIKKQVTIMRRYDSTRIMVDVLDAVKNLYYKTSIFLSNLYGEQLQLFGLICDSLQIRNADIRRLSLQLILNKSDFRYCFTGPRIGYYPRYMSFNRCRFWGMSQVQPRALSIININQSNFNALLVDTMHGKGPSKFTARESDFTALTFKDPLLRTYFFNSVIQDSLRIEDGYRIYYSGGVPTRIKNLYGEIDGNSNTNEYETGISMRGIHMLEESNLYLPPDIDPAKLNLSPTSILNCSINLLVDSSHLAFEYKRAQEYFFKMIQYYEDSSRLDNQRKAAIIDRLAYQQTLYKAKQIAARDFSLYKAGQYLWMALLKHTVNFGYKGEWTFLRTLLLFILVWSLIYFVRFSGEVNDYIYREGQFESDTTAEKHAIKNSLLKSYFACCWFSFIIFANPKFPSAYFKFSRKMFFWLLCEWFLGLGLLLLFLVFIASRYNFIQKLFGFE